jgi:hypothetical protein
VAILRRIPRISIKNRFAITSLAKGSFQNGHDRSQKSHRTALSRGAVGIGSLAERVSRGSTLRLEELRREIAVGLEQADLGEIAPLDVQEIKDEVRRRLAAKG